MKICPRCQKTYTDDNLNFCLEDGSVLAQTGASPIPETVILSQPQLTQPQQAPVTGQQGSQQSWSMPPQQYSMQPKKSSKTWIWVVGILALLVLVCGGGGIVGLIYLGSQADVTNTSNNKSVSPTPTGNKATTTSSSRTDVTSVDLSKWVQSTSSYGNTEFTGGELIMGSKEKGYYYVLAAPADKKTENADTRVTLRNVDNANSRLGYGIIFHSNPTPLQQDYAFLIDSIKKKYRVVHHGPQKETVDVVWTNSDAINTGSAENVLEVRDLSDKIELYINGKMVTSVKNVHGYAGGVAGLYSGDGVRIAFKDMEIRR